MRFRLLAILLLFSLSPSTAQPVDCAADSTQFVQARNYAPLLWLASDEPLYPMLPRPFAFDGIDNDNDGVCDLLDLDEVRMDQVRDKGNAVRELQELLSRLAPSEFTFPYTEDPTLEERANREQAERDRRRKIAGRLRPRDENLIDTFAQQQIAKTNIYIDSAEFESQGLITPDLRAKFAAKGIVLTDYTTVTWDGDTQTIESYDRVGKVHRRVWDALPECPEPCRIDDTLARHLVREKLDGLTWIVRRDGGWFLGSGPMNGAWTYRLQEVDKDVAVFGRGKQIYTSRRDRAAKLVTIAHSSRLPPPRVMYKNETVEGHRLTQYWSYYLYDIGDGSHQHDGEHVFSFRDEIGVVRCVVGAGHTPASANNILVGSPKLDQSTVRPSGLPNHIPVLVELGKHASAPDRGLNGRFDIGMDANVYYRDVWGTRDLAAAIGVTSLRPVQPKFSFPRDFSTLLVERDWERRHLEQTETDVKLGLSGTSQRMETRAPDGTLGLDRLYMLSIPKKSPSRFRDVADGGNSNRRVGTPENGCAEDPPPKDGDGLLTYELFPIEDYEYLVDELLANACVGSDTTDCWSRPEVTAWLEVHKTCFWGSWAPAEIRIADDVFAEMVRWPKKKDSKRDVWRHDNYRRPNDIFKPWLFPRLAGFGSFMQESGDSRFRGGARFTIGLLPNSTLEVGAGFAVKRKAFRDLLGTLYFFRGSHQGWYMTLGWGHVPQRGGIGVLAGGFVPFIWDAQGVPDGFKKYVRWLGHTRLMIHTGIRAEIDEFSDPMLPLKFQLGISFSHSVVPPPHPLRY